MAIKDLQDELRQACKVRQVKNYFAWKNPPPGTASHYVMGGIFYELPDDFQTLSQNLN